MRVKLTSEVIKEIGKHLAGGNYERDIIDYMGMSSQGYYIWKKDAKQLIKDLNAGIKKVETLNDHDTLLLEFLDTVKKSESVAVLRNVNIIQKAADKTWQAAAWYLERKRFKEWGRKDFVKSDVNLSGKVETVIKVDLPEDLKDKDDVN